MNKGSDDRIPQRRRFSTPVASAQQTPRLRGDLMPRHLQLLRSISMKGGIVLGIIAEANAALRNNDLAATEETCIKRKGAGAEQDKRGGDRSQIEGNKCTDVVVSFGPQKRRDARHEITNGSRSACCRCEKADNNRRPESNCERSDCPNAHRVMLGSYKRFNSVNDCIDRNSQPQKDEANAWPTLRETGKKSLQPMPPRGNKKPQRESLPSFVAEWTPRSSAFSLPPAESSDTRECE
jgi:hypothetical protein